MEGQQTAPGFSPAGGLSDYLENGLDWTRRGIEVRLMQDGEIEVRLVQDGGFEVQLV